MAGSWFGFLGLGAGNGVARIAGIHGLRDKWIKWGVSRNAEYVPFWEGIAQCESVIVGGKTTNDLKPTDKKIDLPCG